jgi:hypothetical protein
MAICLKCLIGGTGTGGGLLPAESQRFRIELNFEPNAEGEAEGERQAVFEGDVVEGDGTNGVSAQGILVGNFGVADETVEREATVETFTRDGSLAFVSLVVRDESGAVTFSASLTPQRAEASRDETVLDAQVFLGHVRAATAD